MSDKNVLITQTEKQTTMLVYLLLFGLVTFSRAAPHEGLPLLAPGGIGGIFKGPDSETIIQGPDGSVITSEQEGGAVIRDNSLDEPIVVAESLQDIEPAPVLVVQEEPRLETQDKLLVQPQGPLSAEAPVSYISGSPANQYLTEGSNLVVSRPATLAEQSKLLVEPIGQPLLVSGAEEQSVSQKLYVPNLQSVLSSTSAPLLQSPSSTLRPLVAVPNESEKINLDNVRNFNQGVPLVEHSSSVGFVSNPQFVINENLVGRGSDTSSRFGQAKLIDAQRIPLDQYLLTDERLQNNEQIARALDSEDLRRDGSLNRVRRSTSISRKRKQSYYGSNDVESRQSEDRSSYSNNYPSNEIQQSSNNNEYDNEQNSEGVYYSQSPQNYYPQNVYPAENGQQYSNNYPSNEIQQSSTNNEYKNVQNSEEVYYSQSPKNYYPQNVNPSENSQQYSNNYPSNEIQQSSINKVYSNVQSPNVYPTENRQQHSNNYPSNAIQQSSNNAQNSGVYYTQSENVYPSENDEQYSRNREPEQSYSQSVDQSPNLEYGARLPSSNNRQEERNYYPTNDGQQYSAPNQEQYYLVEQQANSQPANAQQRQELLINEQYESNEGSQTLNNYQQEINDDAKQLLPDISQHLAHESTRLRLPIPEAPPQNYYQQEENYAGLAQTGYYPDKSDYDGSTDIRRTVLQSRTHPVRAPYPSLSQLIIQSLPTTVANNTPLVLGLDNTTFDVTGNVDYQDSPYAARNPTEEHLAPLAPTYPILQYQRQPVLLGPGDSILPVNLSFAVNPSAVPIRNLGYIPGIKSITTFAPTISPATTIASDLVSPTSSPFNISSDYYIANNARSGNLAGNPIVSKKLFAFSTGQVLLRNLTDIGGAIIGNLTYPPPTPSPILKTTKSPFRTTTQRTGLLLSVIQSIARMIG